METHHNVYSELKALMLLLQQLQLNFMMPSKKHIQNHRNIAWHVWKHIMIERTEPVWASFACHRSWLHPTKRPMVFQDGWWCAHQILLVSPSSNERFSDFLAFTIPCGRPNNQWEFQDPKLEVLYHIRPYFVGIFPYIGLI
jgi:hypothetical protein